MDNELREARLAGIGHENFMVRSGALSVVAAEQEPGERIAMMAIRQIEKHGWRNAFEFPHMIQDLPHSAKSVEWVADWLVESAPRTDLEGPQHHLASWLCKAPVQWLSPQIGRFVETLTAEWPPFTGSIRSNPVTFANPQISFARAVDRLESGLQSEAKLREQLEATLEQCAGAKDFPHAEIRRLEVICEALAARGACNNEATGAWLDIANPDPARTVSVAEYRAGAALMLIHRAKIRPPVERIVRLFEFDWDWLNELVEGAIVAGGNRDTLRALLTIFPKQPWHAKLYLSSVLERLRFDGFEESLIDLLRHEEADNIRVCMARALALYGSEAAVVAAKEIVAEAPQDPERKGVLDVICVDEILTGRESKESRRHLNEMIRQHQQQSARLPDVERIMKSISRIQESNHPAPIPFIPAPPRAASGRNDPCPCGSGRKFKKCCG